MDWLYSNWPFYFNAVAPLGPKREEKEVRTHRHSNRSSSRWVSTRIRWGKTNDRVGMHQIAYVHLCQRVFMDERDMALFAD